MTRSPSAASTKSWAAPTFSRGARVRRSGSCVTTCSAASAADHCTLKRPSGFPLPLPIRYTRIPGERPFTLTPQEMLARHDLLNVRQAAYCLNVSERKIYDYIAEGKLVKLRDNPVRVRAAEVQELRKDFDE